MGLFEKKSTFQKLTQGITNLLAITVEIDDEFYERLEETLLLSDIGIDTTEKILAEMKSIADKRNLYNNEKIKEALIDIIKGLIDKGERNKLSNESPLIILMIGINGGGKTTSIAKMANKLKNSGKSVMLAAADTFRAAAADQLAEWGDRIGVRTIRHEEGTDPSAVIYDAIQSAKANEVDVLICDTAGRLQNKRNLMKELEKMDRIISREYPEAARETILVLDATTGKNAINQAEEFNEIAEITGIILTKLDGTARGGIAITIADQFDMPIKFIGMGEGINDLLDFDPVEFSRDIFEEDSENAVNTKKVLEAIPKEAEEVEEEIEEASQEGEEIVEEETEEIEEAAEETVQEAEEAEEQEEEEQEEKGFKAWLKRNF